MALRVTDQRFEELVDVALAQIPAELLDQVENCALIIEDEPGIRADTKAIWERLIPADPTWQHNERNAGEDNGHSHLRGQLQGHSLTIPFNDGTMVLGTWQQVVVLDFDTRARTRDVVLQIIGE